MLPYVPCIRSDRLTVGLHLGLHLGLDGGVTGGPISAFVLTEIPLPNEK